MKLGNFRRFEQEYKLSKKANMQTVISLFLSTCLFAALYQFIAPRFSSGEVAFQPVSVGHKMLFGLAMTVVSKLAMFALAILASVTLVPLTVLVGLAPDATAPPSAALAAVSIAVLLVMLQLANWFSTMMIGRFMPNILRVDSASAGFKAALAPTVVTGAFYLLVVFLLGPLMAVPQ